MNELHIPNGYHQLWKMYLLSQGLDYKHLDSIAPYISQLDHVLSQPIDSQSPYTFFNTVMQATQQELNCPNLVFQMAELIRPEHFGVLGYMATRSNSVAEALQYIMKFSRLVIDGADITPMQLSYVGDEFYLTWPMHDAKYALVNELTTACMAHLAKQIFPASLVLNCMKFAHAQQMARFHYEKFFGCKIEFEHSEYAFVLNSASLDVKSALADPSLMQLLLKQAEDAIASKPRIENIKQQLHLHIAQYLKQYAQAPKIEQIADELYTSVRTLQRQLAEADSSFKKVLEIERMKRIEQLLLQPLSLLDIALQLGYSDQSALARAYKSYTGQTLLQRRKALKLLSSDL